jgi:uncharacterized protein (TIGR02099 family)
MSQAARPKLRHTRRVLGYGALVLLILFATGVGIANQLLPLVERHPDRIAAWLSERVGQPVTFTRAHAEWTRRGPRFTLDGLRVGQPEDALLIGRAQLQVAMYSGVLPGRPLTELKIRDLALRLEQGEDRRWRLVGLPGQQQADPLETLEGFGELQIEKARLAIRAPRHKLDLMLPRVDLRIRVGEKRLKAGASIWADTGSAPMHVAADLVRGDYEGVLWAGGEQLRLADWSPLLADTGVRATGGSGRFGVWALIDDQKISRLTVETDLTGIELASADALARADGSARPVRAGFERLQALARWDLRGDRWHVQAPQLRFRRAGKDASLDGLRLDGGEMLRLGAGTLDLAPLASLLALSPRLPAKLRAWLDASNPRAVLHEVALQRDKSGGLRGRVRVTDFAMDPVGSTPGLSGLGAALSFDGEGGIARLANAPVRLEWRGAFREPVDMHLDGSLGWWREPSGWQVGGSGLRVVGNDFSANLRVQIGFQPDSKPRLDLAADLGPASFATAKKFWPRHVMPATTVRWLDDALVSGRVEDARAVFAGDLDDWPFRNHTGVFDARARIRDATLRFSPDWPAAEHLDADVAFDGPGFTVAGTAALGGNPVTRVEGGIAEFKAPLLVLDIDADSRAETLRTLLLASPMQKTYGEHLRAATAKGDAQVRMRLELPLAKTAVGPKRIEGELHLSDATLADSRWDVHFDQVNGSAKFSDTGFAARELQVRFEQQPALFDLDVGPAFTGDAKAAGLARLRASLPAQALLRRYPALDWLEPRLQGASGWDVTVRIPTTTPGQPTPPSQLRLATDLRGTAITLPAPLAKAADESLPLELIAPLPIDKGEVTLKLGDVLHMRAVLRDKAPMRAALQFGGAAAPAPPAQGMVVRGEVGKLDAAGWIAFSASGGDEPSPLREIDLQAREFMLVDRGFPNTHLRLERAATSTRLAIEGESLQGTVEIPSDTTKAVQGRFARMWWAAAPPAKAAADGDSTAPSSPAGSNAGETTATPPPAAADADARSPAMPPDASAPVAATAANESTDPTRVPSLRFTIDDLRLGRAQLGQTELATTRIASGMRIERFQTRAKSLSMDAAGEWVRTPGGSRSNLKLDFKADNLGQMLDALGFVGMVDGGKTTATLAGSWPGSPGNFSLAALGGTLHAEVGEGRLLDVEPGGSGRILGLISLAEIPRRMTLDFSDFFAKGFSFNTARGDFTFNDGYARTDNLRIDGPAAEIRVTGSADLRREVYDQRVEVLPKAGGMLPALGMLAGGPAGAAIGVVAQAVLQKPLKQTTRVVYKITGPWKKPVVEVIERGPERNPPPPPVNPPAAEATAGEQP